MNVSSCAHKLNTGKEQFFQWADQAAKDCHFSSGNVTHLKKAFNQRFQNCADSSSCISARGNFIAWAKRAQADGHFTPGNLRQIERKINQVISDQLFSEPKVKSQDRVNVKLADDTTDYKVDQTVWQLMKNKMAPFHQFLTDKKFVYDPKKYYDFGVEDIFGVLWIDQKKDAQFIKKFRRKFNDTKLDTGARFANVDTARYLHDPKSHEKLRYILTYCLSKLSANEQNWAIKFLNKR